MNTQDRTQRYGLMQGRLLLLALVVVCIVGHASAAGPATTEETNLIQINIESTRPDLTVGTGLGVMAEITNLSVKNAVYLTERDCILTPSPELINAGGELVGWAAYFPDIPPNRYYIEPSELEKKGEKKGEWVSTVELKPGGKITAFWWNKPEAETATTAVQTSTPPKAPGMLARLGNIRLAQALKGPSARVYSELRFIFFSPGDYKVTVSTKYWVHPEQPWSQNYHHAVQSKTFHASAPQSVILLGAAIGGLVAYVILPQARRRFIKSMKADERTSFLRAAIRRCLHEIGGAVVAILLSMIVTILLSRIAETQFFIRVTVSDIWGATTIGFVANYAGSTIIANILDKVSRSGSGKETGVSP